MQSLRWPLPRPALPLQSLGRLVGRFSVRSRIVVLALTPAIGFLAIGITYVSGENQVGYSFATLKRSRELADASRDFKIAVAAMRIATKDFTVSPHGTLVNDFIVSQKAATKNLDVIEKSMGGKHNDDIATLRQSLAGVKSNFDKLVTEQRTLGFSETEGLRNDLRQAGNAIERAINANMTWLADADAKKLMIALLIMQHYESLYRLNPSDLNLELFNSGYKQFTETFVKIAGTPEMKTKLERDVKHYADTFENWIKVSERAYPLRALIDIDSQSMLPRADAIIQQANAAAAQASIALAATQARTRAGIVGVDVAVVVLGLFLSWLIGRSITRPLNGLAVAMRQLADGDTEARIPATQAHDEIGVMARSVIVFRDTTVERARLAASRAEVRNAAA